MQITFADGTSIEVAESALDDFVRYDLKWVEFVHGPASEKLLSLRKPPARPAKSISESVRRCPPPSPRGC